MLNDEYFLPREDTPVLSPPPPTENPTPDLPTLTRKGPILADFLNVQPIKRLLWFGFAHHRYFFRSSSASAAAIIAAVRRLGIIVSHVIVRRFIITRIVIGCRIIVRGRIVVYCGIVISGAVVV